MVQPSIIFTSGECLTDRISHVAPINKICQHTLTYSPQLAIILYLYSRVLISNSQLRCPLSDKGFQTSMSGSISCLN